MKRKSEDRIFIIGRFILKCLLVYSFLAIYVGVGGYLVFQLFFAHKLEVLALTYYGFATLAALSNICFSYCRSLNETHPHHKYLRELAERFLWGAVTFLFGAVLNYFVVHMAEYFPKMAAGNWLQRLCEVTGGIFFTVAFSIAATAFYYLLDHLFERLTLNKDNYHV